MARLKEVLASGWLKTLYRIPFIAEFIAALGDYTMVPCIAVQNITSRVLPGDGFVA